MASACAGDASSTYQGPTNSIPGQNTAINIIWNEVYNASAYEVPPILWRTGDTCNGNPGWLSDEGVCIGGQYNPVENYVQVEYTTSVISNSGLPHELAHAAHTYMNNGDCDTEHQSAYFLGSPFYYGNPGSLLEAARAALINDGM
jgi:hypothetical protein